MVRLPSGVRYWTVLDEELAVVPVADSFLRQVRFGRDGAESTTKAYAGGIALFLRWCARSGRSWEIEQLADELTDLFGRRVDLVSSRALHPLLRPSVLAEARPCMQRDILLLTEMIDAAEQGQTRPRNRSR